jgi:PAS domain S-box-containing protein
VDEAYSSSLREGRDSYEIEHRIVRKSIGEVRYVREKCEHVRDETGRIIRSVGMVHDITGRREAERALRESEERLSTVFNSVHDAIFVHTEDQRILAVNDKMLEMYGVTREEALNSHKLLDFSVPGQETLAEEIWQEVRAGKPRLTEWVGRHAKTGKLFDVELFIKRIEYDGREAILASVRDITERKRAKKNGFSARTRFLKGSIVSSMPP